MKNKIIICLLCFCSLFSFNFVRAAEEGISLQSQQTEGQGVYRNVKHSVDENGQHVYDCRIYNYGGIKNFSFILSEELNNRSSYFVTISANKELAYYYIADGTNKFKVFTDWQGDFKLMANSGSRRNIIKLVYNFDTNQWSKSGETNVWMSYGGGGFGNKFFANDIVLQANCTIELWESESSNNRVNYDLFRRYNVFKSPTMKQLSDGFRVYLNDFVSSAGTSTDTIVEDFSLTGLSLTVHDLISDTRLSSNFDVLGYTDVQQDDEGRYYIDLKFSDFSYLHPPMDADIMIFLTSTLQENVFAHAFDNVSNKIWYTMATKYQSLDYWRYKYSADSGVGLLVEVYPDGTEKPKPDNPDNPEPEPDPNQNVVNAISGLGTSIDEQTNAVKENTETQKSILQKIIDIPRANNFWAS